MLRPPTVTLVTLLTLLAAPLRDVGVKETVAVTIVDSMQQRSWVVTDPAVLELSNVFSGAFIHNQASEPDAAWPRYTVSFDVQCLDGVKAVAYTVYYALDPRTAKGFVYLPGPRDPPYHRNVSTIIRDGQDGEWHYASSAWSAAINAQIEAQAPR